MKTLNDIATIAAGYPFRGKIPDIQGATVLAVQMKDASPVEGVLWDSCIATELPAKRDTDWLQPGDILIAARGNHNYAVLVDEYVNQAGIRAVAAPHFFVVRTNRAGVAPGYLAWFLNQEPCQRYFTQNAEGSLTKSIRRSVLGAVQIPLPSIAKQRAIIGLADNLKRELQLIEQLRRNGEQLLYAIARDLLVDE